MVGFWLAFDKLLIGFWLALVRFLWAFDWLLVSFWLVFGGGSVGRFCIFWYVVFLIIVFNCFLHVF